MITKVLWQVLCSKEKFFLSSIHIIETVRCIEDNCFIWLVIQLSRERAGRLTDVAYGFKP